MDKLDKEIMQAFNEQEVNDIARGAILRAKLKMQKQRRRRTLLLWGTGAVAAALCGMYLLFPASFRPQASTVPVLTDCTPVSDTTFTDTPQDTILYNDHIDRQIIETDIAAEQSETPRDFI